MPAPISAPWSRRQHELGALRILGEQRFVERAQAIFEGHSLYTIMVQGLVPVYVGIEFPGPSHGTTHT